MGKKSHAIKFKTIVMNINTHTNQKNRLKRVVVYPSKYEIDTGQQESVEKVIRDIQVKISRDFIAKERLPVAYFSVVDFNGRKTNQNVTEHSGLIIIDIDVKDNPDTDF